jgi:hypothetical protein
VALGLSLILGAHFLGNERRDGWRPDSMQVGWFQKLHFVLICHVFCQEMAARFHAALVSVVCVVSCRIVSCARTGWEGR